MGKEIAGGESLVSLRLFSITFNEYYLCIDHQQGVKR